MFQSMIIKAMLKKLLIKALGEEKAKVVLESHSIGVATIAVVAGTYVLTNPEQVTAILGERYGGILLILAGAAFNVARLYKSTPSQVK